jgi:uncharacterized SAM-binding protein YcdF (DUF218 family)
VRSAWSALLAIAAGFWLLVLVGLPLYVFPPADGVAPSDAVFVLGPPMEERLALAEQLRDEDMADRIVVSVQAADGQTADDLALCRDGEATCAVADPSTTRGEVLLMNELAGAEEAPSLIVVTSTPHVARTRYLFDKCYPGEVAVVGAERPASLEAWATQYVYQTLSFVKAFVEPCPSG